MDIETSPCLGWFWRPGPHVNITYNQVLQHAQIICAAWKWAGSDRVHTAHWGKDKNDKDVVIKLVSAMNEADLILAHNGDRFDFPWVRTRALAHGIHSLPRWRTMDTVKSARSNLKLPSNRLDDIGDYYGLGRKTKTDPDLWNEIVFGKGKRLKEMVSYCGNDVVLLEKIHEKLHGVVPHKIHLGVVEGYDKWSCPHCASTEFAYQKQRPTAAGTIRHQVKCSRKTCGHYFTISSPQYAAYLKHRMLNAK